MENYIDISNSENMEIYLEHMRTHALAIKSSVEPCEVQSPFMRVHSPLTWNKIIKKRRHNAVLKKTLVNYRKKTNEISNLYYWLNRIVQEKNIGDMLSVIFPYLLERDELGQAPQYWKGTDLYRHNYLVKWNTLWDTISGRLVYLGYPKYNFQVKPFELELYMFTRSIPLTDAMIQLVRAWYEKITEKNISRKWRKITYILNELDLKTSDKLFTIHIDLAVAISDVLDTMQADVSHDHKVIFYIKNFLPEEQFNLVHTWYKTMNPM